MSDVFIVVIYLDDIVIYLSSYEQHLEHVCSVLQRLREHQLYVKAEKCIFNATEVEFLGYDLTDKGVCMNKYKVKAIIDWPPPTSVKTLQYFLGFSNIYSRFIHSFSALVTPLTSLISSKVPFSWNADAQSAFDALKVAFTTVPVLQQPNPELPFLVETDASGVVVGAILSQRCQDTGD
ncbi:uncharacterized protein [Ambystoma mexicanum]|uniref:uncharacterized protein n=1 Tax=Ambystoma mexicanum TaxID=8296 RepID=UPI0037E708F2